MALNVYNVQTIRSMINKDSNVCNVEEEGFITNHLNLVNAQKILFGINKIAFSVIILNILIII